jgi:hypothetical protein
MGHVENQTALSDFGHFCAEVLDEVWEEAARHYYDEQLGALVLSIATINTWTGSMPRQADHRRVGRGARRRADGRRTGLTPLIADLQQPGTNLPGLLESALITA